MVDINELTLMGRLSQEPDVRYTDAGEPVVTLTVATGSGTGERRKSEFTECVFFQKNAERLVEFDLPKGARIMTRGRKDTDKWDAPDGTKMRKVRMIGNFFNLLDQRAAAEEGSE